MVLFGLLNGIFPIIMVYFGLSFFYFWFYGLSTVESLIANAPLGWNVLVLFYCVISEIM